ncbi:hypothetical protein CC1G_03935 [Coprinopsis cinerea okayama7|uniref:F-box domain-containing protein n=1 Tax=Coprinopsis cinerea (strain Okayama-7 / 130 / ATCC MYA-4618 / FGSC 9003) TaxID=240176 RepID=A8N888_COPC7|nr:hypothetical protein CC1G_03935 [Coprinopsis cinerea okayama7\|eukprot:XP_001831044.1 hypothetical protein CC1G_03935 [Coprinopsis cinerea okayama7\
MSNVPLELIELIVAYLACQGTLGDLSQCALVNKEFASLCQKRIFHTVMLVQKEEGWVPPEERVELPLHPIERFAEVVKQNPAIGTYVRELELESMYDYNIDDGFVVLENLHQVHTFTLAFADGPRHAERARPWGTISPGLRSSLLSFVRRNPVTSLSLFNIGEFPHTFLRECRHLETLSVLNIEPDESIFPSSSDTPVKIQGLTLLDGSIRFAEHFILHPTSPAMDISEASTLKVHFGKNDDNHVVVRVLTLPSKLESLDLELEKNYSEWTCRNNILSKLPPSSLKTLRSITLILRTWDTPEFPAYGDFVHELALMQGQNVLEDLNIIPIVQIGCDLNVDLGQWKTLDDLLSMGFPRLRKLTIRAYVTFFDSPSPFEDAADRQAQLDRIFAECFDWSKRHLHLTTSTECWVI